jgi:hypothetical protein
LRQTMAIVLDGAIVEAANINAAIRANFVITTGDVSEAETLHLVGQLHAAVFQLPSTQPSTNP